MPTIASRKLRCNHNGTATRAKCVWPRQLLCVSLSHSHSHCSAHTFYFCRNLCTILRILICFILRQNCALCARFAQRIHFHLIFQWMECAMRAQPLVYARERNECAEENELCKANANVKCVKRDRPINNNISRKLSGETRYKQFAYAFSFDGSMHRFYTIRSKVLPNDSLSISLYMRSSTFQFWCVNSISEFSRHTPTDTRYNRSAISRHGRRMTQIHHSFGLQLISSSIGTIEMSQDVSDEATVDG